MDEQDTSYNPYEYLPNRQVMEAPGRGRGVRIRKRIHTPPACPPSYHNQSFPPYNCAPDTIMSRTDPIQYNSGIGFVKENWKVLAGLAVIGTLLTLSVYSDEIQKILKERFKKKE